VGLKLYVFFPIVYSIIYCPSGLKEWTYNRGDYFKAYRNTVLDCSTVYRGDLWSTRLDNFIPRETAPFTHCVRGLVVLELVRTLWKRTCSFVPAGYPSTYRQSYSPQTNPPSVRKNKIENIAFGKCLKLLPT
jgi:hypothetical protein